MQALLPILSYALPLVGKLLLMIPFVPNKAIPFILLMFNVAHKYWVLAGLPTVLEGTGALESGVNMALAIPLAGTIVPVVWGLAETFLFHSFYEGRKAKARIEGKTSWWEKGKKSMF